VKKKINVNSEKEMILLGERLGELVSPGMVFALNGDLGAGKTTLVKGIGKGLNISEIINSPTFTILKIYYGRLTLYHLDVYRINEDSGDDYLEEYFYQDGVAVIEWAKNINYLLPNDFLDIKINIISENVREVTFNSESFLYINLIESVLI